MAGVLPTLVSALSHTGCVRRVNQDAWSYSVEAGLFLVCDGMGGAVGGEVASRTAVEAFVEHLGPLAEGQRTSRAVAQSVCAANHRVYARASHEPGLRGMGTTLVGLVACGLREVAVAHVGDSRCYLWRQGTLIRCTEDHSLVAEQMRMGVLSAEQALRSPMQHVITRAIGTRRSVEPEVRRLPVSSGDVFLLCSDGLTREISEEAIARILWRDLPLGERNASLMEAAMEAGGRDNITSLLVEIA